MRLALGTVQFGLPYGVANRGGQVTRAEAQSILLLARREGIDTLDTAVGYGESERCLGDIGVDGWRIVSKLPPVSDDCADVQAWVKCEVERSLERLRVPRLRGLLLHRPQQLLGRHGAALRDALLRVKQAGMVDLIGVSIYDPAELEALISRLPIELVQAPSNILDRRLMTSGWLARLADLGVEVHLRSVFLQGLLLMPANVRPVRFDRWSSLWAQWDTWLSASGVTALQACLGFALAQLAAARIVVGVDTSAQLAEVVDAASRPIRDIPDALQCDDLDLIDPSRWQAA